MKPKPLLQPVGPVAFLALIGVILVLNTPWVATADGPLQSPPLGYIHINPLEERAILSPVLLRLPLVQGASESSRDVKLARPPEESPRSTALERTAREADLHTQRGFELADRGAFHSAREEFILSLRILAQGLDTEHATREHAQALAEGLRALDEADDFLPKGSRLEADLRLEHIVASHQTRVLKSADMTRLTPMVAMRAYLTFAQERLASAAGSEFAGSMALYALGKLHRAMGRELPESLTAADSKAVAAFQASLLARPNNAMAANELGTLLATAGRLEESRYFLERSVEHWPSPVVWRNLSVVYSRLGRLDAAALAANQAQALSTIGQAPAEPGTVAVDWVGVEEFNKPRPGDPVYDRPDSPPEAQPAVVPKTAARPPTPANGKKGFFPFQ